MNRLVGNDIGEIPLHTIGAIGIVEVGIVVVALRRKDVPVVKTGGAAHQVPLSHDGSLITCLLQEFGHCLLGTIEDTMLIVGETILVRVLTCEHAGTRGTTEGVGNKRTCKLHPILCDAIEVGSLNVATIIRRKHLRGVVVRHDVDDVVALLSRSTEGQ